MLDGINCVGCGIISPQKNTPRRPWVLDETLPKHRNPQEVMNERMRERALERAKNKPAEERDIFDYLILADDYYKKNPIVKYMA